MSTSKVIYEHDKPSQSLTSFCYLKSHLENTPLTLKALRTFQSKESMTNTRLQPQLWCLQFYTANTKRCFSHFDFPLHFNVTFTKFHCSNKEKAVKYFEKVIFPFFQKTKGKHRYAKEQTSLVTMDTFKGEDNEILKKLFVKIFCEVVIVLKNLTNRFIDSSFSKAAKSFFFREIITSKQLGCVVFLCDVNAALQLGIIKPLHEKLIHELYTRLQREL